MFVFLHDFVRYLDVINIKFEPISIDMNSIATAKTPAQLEALALKHYPLKQGEFMFLEWTKFTTEDILVTSDRSALISSQTSKMIVSLFFLIPESDTRIYLIRFCFIFQLQLKFIVYSLFGFIVWQNWNWLAKQRILYGIMVKKAT